MTTPIENLTQNVNASTQQTVLQAVADDPVARQQAADKASAINAIIDNADQQAVQNFFGGIAGDATAEDGLTGNDALIDKVSEDVDAIETLNASESAIRKMLCRREGLDPANFADLDAVADDQGLMQDIVARQQSSKILARGQKAVAAAAASQVAMDEIGNSATARQEVLASSTALSEIRSVEQALAKLIAGEAGEDASSYPDMATLAGDATAMQGVAASQTAMQGVAASQTAMQEIAASSTAMQEVAGSSTAMQEVAGSSTAMDKVAGSSTAMQQVANSQTAMQQVVASATAMQTVANSQTALDEIGNNATVQNTVYNNNTAVSALNSSNLLSSASDNVDPAQSSSLRNDRVILLSHNTGSEGSRSNQPVFTNSSNDLPQTAGRIRRNNNRGNFAPGAVTHSATFIDIGDS